MARSKKPSLSDPRWAPVPDAVLDHFAPPGILHAADVEAATQRFKKALLERALGAELQHHLTVEAATAAPDAPANHRNGSSAKTVLTDDGTLPLAIPRDRHGTFGPVLIPKHARRFTGFDDKIIALYARGLSVREIQAFLAEMYAVDVSPDLISTVTDAVLSEVTAWQARPLEPMYPVVFFDALHVKIRDETVVRSKAVYLALAVLPDGSRDILGVWIEQSEGAKFWMKVFADLQTRGCRDILIAVTDGLKGMSEALAAIFPATTLQTCIVHLLRHSLHFASWTTRKSLAAALRPIYTAPSAEVAAAALDTFAAGPWGTRFPMIAPAWHRAWTHVVPFFAFPPDVRRVIYTTNTLENVNRQVRKTLKTRGHFPNDDAATKLIWLALRHVMAGWHRPAPTWKAAMNQFAILYEDRFTQPQA
jgi:transposase-like protein